MPNRREFDHIGAYNFKVEIEGVTVAAFQRVEGLDSITEVIEFQDGEDIILRKRPGRTRYGNIVLTRGYTHSDELWTWRKAVVDGKVERKAGSIIILADDASEIGRYNFFEGWPCRWTFGPLDGRADFTMIEILEIAVEKIERG
ncbi:MAG: phage tail protein [Rhodobiaceae bacterium]|nr:phage tail protein [Rhodobiaceae bacterium]